MNHVADIEIDIFSGRPNPTYAIHGLQAKQLEDILHRSRTRLDDYRRNDGLGFRGFVVHLGPDHSETYRIIGDVLVKGEEPFHDPGRTAQGYIVSILPDAMKSFVVPFVK